MSMQDILTRLCIALIIGGIIGSERESMNRPAGFRTHIMVCIGTTIVSLIQVTIVENAITIINNNTDLSQVMSVDLARLGGQAITGIGFLGAGTIMHSKGSVSGLTTAASLWLVGVIGLAVGMGYYSIAIIGATLVFITLVILKKFQERFITIKETETILQLTSKNKEESIKFIIKVFNEKNINVLKLSSCELEKKDIVDSTYKNTVYLKYTVTIPSYISVEDIINTLIVSKDIQSVEKLS